MGYEPSHIRDDGFLEAAAGPRSFDVDEKGNIYIADTEKKRIVKFSKEGKYLLSISNGMLKQPIDIAVSGIGEIYVLDLSSEIPLYKYDSSGQFREKVTDEKQGKTIWMLKSSSQGGIIMNYSLNKQPDSKYFKLSKNGDAVGEVKNWWENNRNASLKKEKDSFLLFQDNVISETLNLKSLVPRIEDYSLVGFDDEGSIYLLDTLERRDARRKMIKLKKNRIAAIVEIEPTLSTLGFTKDVVVKYNGDIYQMRAYEKGLQIIEYKLY